MKNIEVRAMTEPEYDAWLPRLNESYAQSHRQAGTWTSDEALANAQRDNEQLLPLGVHTPRMMLLTGVDPIAGPVGFAWVGLDHPRGVKDAAFIYNIEVVEHRRGQGYGRALLTAVERAARAAGARALGLNVFASNRVAQQLYVSSDYEITSQMMIKDLGGRSDHGSS